MPTTIMDKVLGDRSVLDAEEAERRRLKRLAEEEEARRRRAERGQSKPVSKGEKHYF